VTDQILPSVPLAAPQPVVTAPHGHGRRNFVVAGGVLLAIAVAAAGWWAYVRPAAVVYTTAPAARGAVIRTVTATGTVNPVLTVIVGSYISGVIQQLFCDYNTEVKKDQICAKIDPRPYQSVVDQNQANLDIAKAQLDKDKAALVYAKLNSDRNTTLAARKFTSQDIADAARSVLDQAAAQIGLDEATIALHQALLDAAKVNLGYTDIVSPVDGTVVSRNVTMGQTVAATFQTPTLFLIASDLTKMQVDTNVSESDIGVLKEGAKASFTVDAFPGRVFAGAVVQVRQSPQTVQNVVTYDVVVSVDNTDLALKPGMTASTQIIVESRADVLRVPDQAVRYLPAGTAPAGEGAARLFVLRDGKEVAVPVVLGLDDDSFTEIVSGELKPGDLVISAAQSAAAARPALPAPRL
jgi:HlyD family secretion protein